MQIQLKRWILILLVSTSLYPDSCFAWFRMPFGLGGAARGFRAPGGGSVRGGGSRQSWYVQRGRLVRQAMEAGEEAQRAKPGSPEKVKWLQKQIDAIRAVQKGDKEFGRSIPGVLPDGQADCSVVEGGCT